MIIVDQKGLSKEIFWRSKRLARDLYFLHRDDAKEVIKGFKEFHSNLTHNGTCTIAQTMEIEFPFPLRSVKTPHAPYDKEFYPDKESETHGAASILTGVNLDIIVDWNDVSRPQTGRMRRNCAKPRTSFSATGADNEFSIPSHQRYSVSSQNKYNKVYFKDPAPESCPADHSFGVDSYCEDHKETSHASESVFAEAVEDPNDGHLLQSSLRRAHSSNSMKSRRSGKSVASASRKNCGDAADDNDKDLAADDGRSVGQLSHCSNSSHSVSSGLTGGTSTIATESYHFVRSPTPKKVAPKVPFLPIAEDDTLESDDLNSCFSGFHVTGNSAKPSSFLSAGGGTKPDNGKSDASRDSRRSHHSSHSQGSMQNSSHSQEGSRCSSQQSRALSTAGKSHRSRDVPGRHTSQHSVKSKHSFLSASKKSSKDTITSRKKSSGQSSLSQPFPSSISKSSSCRKKLELLQNAQPNERSNSSEHGKPVPPLFISVTSLSDDAESMSYAASQPLNTTQILLEHVDDLLTSKNSDVEDLHGEIITAHPPSESCCSLTYNTGHQEEQHSVVSKVSSAKSNIASHTRSKHRKQK